MTRLWGAAFCGYLALGATLQTLPAFTEHRFHASPVLIGTLVGAASLAAAVSRPFAGRSVDAGRTRATVLLGATFGVLGGLGHLWAPNVIVLLLARLLLGAGEGTLFTSAVSWVLTLSRTDERARVAGWFGLSMWSGLSLGPLFAVGLTEWLGAGAVWLAVTMLPIIAALLVLGTPKQQAHRGPVRELTLFPRGARLPGLAYLLSSYGYGAITAMLLLYLSHRGIGTGNMALAVFSVVFLLTRMLGSNAVNRMGGVWMTVLATGIEAAGLVVVAMSPTAACSLIGTAITGAGVALLYPAMVAIIVARARHEEQGAALGAIISFWDLGIMTAGPVSGLIAALAGYPAVFLVAAMLAALSGAGTATLLSARTEEEDYEHEAA